MNCYGEAVDGGGFADQYGVVYNDQVVDNADVGRGIHEIRVSVTNGDGVDACAYEGYGTRSDRVGRVAQVIDCEGVGFLVDQDRRVSDLSK